MEKKKAEVYQNFHRDSLKYLIGVLERDISKARNSREKSAIYQELAILTARLSVIGHEED